MIAYGLAASDGEAAAANTTDVEIGDADLSNHDISVAVPAAGDLGSRYVIDYTVGPPGVGPVMSVTSREPQVSPSRTPLAE